MKRLIFRLLITGIVPVTMVLMLYQYSRSRKADGGFDRYFIPHAVSFVSSADLFFDSYYFAGTGSDTIYLGNKTAHKFLLLLDHTLRVRDSIELKISFPFDPSSSELHENANSVFLSDGNHAILLDAKLTGLNMYSVPLPGIAIFTACLPISNRSVILRTYDDALKKTTLTKIQVGNPITKKTADLLEKTVDGYFSCDGSICQDEESRHIIYVYRYRNRFIVTDSNLNLLYQARTIDTTRIPNIKLGSYPTNHGLSTTFSAPPHPVNGLARADQGLLYVLSRIKAKNEENKDFGEHNTIDVYALRDGHYKFSFYLPMVKGKRIKDFVIRNQKFFALEDHFIRSYTLTFK